MIQTVDVNKLACEFIRQVTLYLASQKYIIDPCEDNIKQIYLNYKLATSLIACLEHEDECLIKEVAITLSPYTPCLPNVMNCGDTATITLTSKTTTCNSSMGIRKLNGINSTYPDVVLVNDSTHHPAKIEVYANTCNSTESVIVESQEKYSQNISFVLQGPQLYANGYIKTLRVYKTDTNGVLDPTPINLNLSPSNLAAWTSCSECDGINPVDLYFGNPLTVGIWANNFFTLLKNVTYTLLGELNSSWLIPTKTTTSISIGNKVKHNPAGEWLGINKNDFFLEWVNSDGETISVNSPNSTSYTQSRHSMNENVVIPTTCGDFTGTVTLSNGVTSSDLVSTNFNYIGLVTSEISTPAVLSNVVTAQCNITTLTATVSSSQNILSAAWYDSEDNLISENYTVQVTNSGTYYFVLSLEGSCVLTEQITVGEVYNFLVTEAEENLITESSDKLII